MDYVNLQNVTDRLRSTKDTNHGKSLYPHCGDNLCNFDEYDEMLERINSLSLREIHFRILRKHGESTRAFVSRSNHLSEDITNSLLTSITKTFAKKNRCHVKLQRYSFYTTDLFSRLLVLIKVEIRTVEERERRKRQGRD